MAPKPAVAVGWWHLCMGFMNFILMYQRSWNRTKNSLGCEQMCVQGLEGMLAVGPYLNWAGSTGELGRKGAEKSLINKMM